MYIYLSIEREEKEQDKVQERSEQVMRNPSSSANHHNHFTITSSQQIKSKTPCCSKVGLKKGPWTLEEDEILSNYIKRKGEGQWRTLPEHAGLLRCGKSCRLRWMNYLRPSVKHGAIAPDEEDLILRLHRLLGNRWSLIAGRIPGRTDNEIKNYWNTHLSKKLISKGIDPRTHKPFDANLQNPSCSKVLAHDCSTSLQVFPNNPNPNPNYSCDHSGNIRVNNFSSEGLIMEKSDHDHHQANKEEHHMIVNSSTRNEDLIFSSFLNSLINDDENNDNQFVDYQVQELQTNHVVQEVDHDHHKYLAVEPFSWSEFNHDAIWETELEYALETVGQAKENMAAVFDDHPLI